jgi:hypothetical protein
MEQLSFSECRRGYIEFGYETCREMENISTVEVLPSAILSLSEQRGRRLQDYRVLLSPPSSKCNVLCESLSVDSQNIPCATLKRRGSWVISVYLWKHVKNG